MSDNDIDATVGELIDRGVVIKTEDGYRFDVVAQEDYGDHMVVTLSDGSKITLEVLERFSRTESRADLIRDTANDLNNLDTWLEEL